MTELSRRVALSKTPVIARVRQLEALGHITGYGARLGWKQLGLGHITFVEVKLTDTRESALQAFRKSVLEQPEIAECHMIAGSFDYLLKIRTADISAYRRFMGEVISTLPFIASTSTHVVMDAVKEEERFAVDVE
ncbi:UNVERIFIED_CONTAM: hypothetical protein GTU68_056026 [Idotea baltica]|nr:hypothetical protein [Idotea baltica]